MLWLKNHWIALLSVFLAAMYFYFQFRQWQRHGDDFMFLAVNVIITFILCVILIAATGRYVKLVKDLPKRNESEIRRIEKAGMSKSHAGQGDWLARRLEEIWHAFNNAHKTLCCTTGAIIQMHPPSNRRPPFGYRSEDHPPFKQSAQSTSSWFSFETSTE